MQTFHVRFFLAMLCNFRWRRW